MMMMMISSFEFLFIAFDYLSFILEPLLGRLFIRFNWQLGRQVKQNDCQRFCNGNGTVQERFMNQLEVEIESLYANNEHEMTEICARRSELLTEIAKIIRLKWPWLVSIHLANVDEVDGQLNWQDYDICLVDDWDFESLAPRLQLPLDSLTKAAATLKVSTTTTTTTTATATSTPTDLTTTKPVLGTSSSYTTCTQTAVGGRDAQAQMRIIYSSSVDRKVFLQFMRPNEGHEEESCFRVLAPSETTATKTNSTASTAVDGSGGKKLRQQDEDGFDDGQKLRQLKKLQKSSSTTTANNDHYHHSAVETKSILCVKWITIDQFSLLQARAKLVFYYTQLHPELRQLYLLVSSLLECADLIELSAPTSGGATPSTNTASSGCKLSRYALVLMLVAHLESSETSSRKQKDGDGNVCEDDNNNADHDNNHHNYRKHEFCLAKRFIEFLTIYANADRPLLVRPTLRKEAQLEFLLLPTTTGGDNTERKQLVVLDPILSAKRPQLIDCCSTLNDHREQTIDMATAECLKRLTNLTSNVQMDQIKLLFRCLEEHLKITREKLSEVLSNGDSDGDNKHHQCRRYQPLLSGLFALCKRNSQQLATRQQVIFSSDSADFSNGNSDSSGCGCDISEAIPLSSSQSAQLAHLYLHNKASANGNHRPLLTLASTDRTLASILKRRASWSARRFLLNLLYLTIFLLIRNQLLNYLERVRGDLKEQARDDLVQLKYTILAPNYDSQQQQQKLNLASPAHHVPQQQQQQLEDEEEEQVSKLGIHNNGHDPVANGNRLDSVPPDASNQDSTATATDNNNKVLPQELWTHLAQVMLMQTLGGSAGSDSKNEQLKQLMYLLREQLERNTHSDAAAATEDDDDDDQDGEESAELRELVALLEGLAGFSGDDSLSYSLGNDDSDSNGSGDSSTEEELQRDESAVGDEL